MHKVKERFHSLNATKTAILLFILEFMLPKSLTKDLSNFLSQINSRTERSIAENTRQGVLIYDPGWWDERKSEKKRSKKKKHDR